MVGIFQDLRLRRVALAPVPFLLQLVGKGVGILHALDIAARAGIAVPVPGAADAAALLKDPHRETKAAQAVQHVHPGKARADHDDVVAFRAWLTHMAGGHLNGAPRFLILTEAFHVRAKAQEAKPRSGASKFCWAECANGTAASACTQA